MMAVHLIAVKDMHDSAGTLNSSTGYAYYDGSAGTLNSSTGHANYDMAVQVHSLAYRKRNERK